MKICYISCVMLLQHDFLVQALSLTATSATQFAQGTLLAQEILPNPPVSTLPPSSVCQSELDSIFNPTKITANPTDTVVQFVQTYCEPHAQFLSSKISNFLIFHQNWCNPTSASTPVLTSCNSLPKAPLLQQLDSVLHSQLKTPF